MIHTLLLVAFITLLVDAAADERPSTHLRPSFADFSMDYNILNHFSGKTGKGTSGKSGKGASRGGKSGKVSSGNAGKEASAGGGSSMSSGKSSDSLEQSSKPNGYYDGNAYESQYASAYPTFSPTFSPTVSPSSSSTSTPVLPFETCLDPQRCCRSLASNGRPSRWCRNNGCNAITCNP